MGFELMNIVYTDASNPVVDDRYLVWFDIDNTLYSASVQIAHAMGERIHGMSGD